MSTSILITAPEVYSLRFSHALEAHHLKPVVIPLIETVPTWDSEAMRSLLENDLKGIDYVVFCSRCAIDSFSTALSHRYGGAGDSAAATGSTEGNKAGIARIAEVIASCSFATIGKDAEYLMERLHVKPTVCPNEPSPAGIAAKLGEDPAVAGRTVVVLAPCVQEIEEPDVVPRFLAQLTELEMNVLRIDAYVTRPVSGEAVNTAVKMLMDKAVQGVAFTSSAEIIVLLRCSPHCLDSVSVACFGPYTGGFATKQGIAVDCISKDFSSFDGFAAAIEKYFAASSQV